MYKTTFINSLSLEDEKLLREVVLSPRTLTDVDKANSQYQDGPDAWPEDNSFYISLVKVIQLEAMNQIIRMKQDNLEEQKLTAGLLKFTTVKISPEQYLKLQLKANESGVPITKIVNMILDKFMDKIQVNVIINE